MRASDPPAWASTEYGPTRPAGLRPTPQPWVRAASATRSPAAAPPSAGPRRGGRGEALKAGRLGGHGPGREVRGHRRSRPGRSRRSGPPPARPAPGAVRGNPQRIPRIRAERPNGKLQRASRPRRRLDAGQRNHDTRRDMGRAIRRHDSSKP